MGRDSRTTRVVARVVVASVHDGAPKCPTSHDAAGSERTRTLQPPSRRMEGGKFGTSCPSHGSVTCGGGGGDDAGLFVPFFAMQHGCERSLCVQLSPCPLDQKMASAS